MTNIVHNLINKTKQDFIKISMMVDDNNTKLLPLDDTASHGKRELFTRSCINTLCGHLKT